MNSLRTRVAVTGGSGFIGIHLIELLSQLGYEVSNFDIKSPIDGKFVDLWRNVSITDRELLRNELIKFDPHYIIHLAAITTQNAKSLIEFDVNISGTKNLIEITNGLKGIKKIMFTSSQYVNSPGRSYSKNRNDLLPYGFYGESKLLGEDLFHSKLKNISWTIIRPTTIWGPWHPILTDGLWKQILRGNYFHPRGDTAIKAYGYVRNSVWQIVRLLELENAYTDKKVFYIGDNNLAQSVWVNAFVYQITNKKMREIPNLFLFVASEIGELITRMGFNFPLYRSRYRNLVTSNPSPLSDTLDLIGPSPISLEKAVQETVTWLKNRYNNTKEVG